MGILNKHADKTINIFICKKCGNFVGIRKALGTNHSVKCDVCCGSEYILTDMLYTNAHSLCGAGKWDSILPRYFNNEQIQEMFDLRNTLPEEAFRYAPYLTRDTQINHTQDQPEPTYTPTCPTCHSPDVAKIGSIDRASSVLLFGVFSSKINKQFKCKNCGYKW